MASDISYNKNFFTPERIRQLQQCLVKHPIDPAYDEACDNLKLDEKDPTILLQEASRAAYQILEEIGELPEDLRRDKTPPAK